MFDLKNYHNSPLYLEIDFGRFRDTVSVEKISCTELPIHIHGHLELLYVLEGETRVKVSYHNETLSSGKFIVINPFDAHSIVASGEDAKIYMIHISDHILPASENVFTVSNEVVTKDMASYQEVLRLICNIADKYENATAEEMHRLVSDTIKVLKSRYSIEHFTAAGEITSIEEKNELLQRMHSMYKYMYTRFDEKITLESLSNEFAISKAYLSHYIKEAVGVSFQEFVNIIRCDRAEIALLEGKKSINDISERYGFSSTQYFNTAFRSLFYMSPAEYKRTYSKETIIYKNSRYEKLTSNDTETIKPGQISEQEAFSVLFNEDEFSVTAINTTAGKESVRTLDICRGENLSIGKDTEKMIIIIERKQNQ